MLRRPPHWTWEAASCSNSPTSTRHASSSSPTGRRLPGFADVTAEQWRSAQWQRVNCVKNLRQLRGVYGDLLDESFYADVEADQAGRATMSMLLPPQMLNTMVPATTAAARRRPRMLADPVRRYMLPVASDRLPGAAASHPYAARDSLHEHEMWAVEGLTHRYPTKVLAELLSTCPQYCGHCTRMDLVGNSTPAVPKLKFELKPVDRQTAMLDYLRRHPGRPRRRRLRRRRGQPAVQEPRGVRRRAAGDRDRPRHPAGHQGADGPAPALAAGRRRRGHDPAGARTARAPRGQPGRSTPTSTPRSR